MDTRDITETIQGKIYDTGEAPNFGKSPDRGEGGLTGWSEGGHINI